MSSNGLPNRFDESGRLRAATAGTWLHTPTGRRGRPNVSDDANRFWPLRRRYRVGRHPLITRLRKGAEHGGHWLAVDTDPARAASPDRFLVLDHREEIAPPDARWIPARVTATAVWYGTYPALIADGYTIAGQGDMVARFTLPTVHRMIADLRAENSSTDQLNDPMPGETAALRLDGDVLTVSWSDADEHWTDIDRVYPDRDGHYAVGAYLWPWTPVSPTRSGT